MKVLVGMSGGVDSTVAALMLKEKGYEVEGVIMRIWENDPDNILTSNKNSCFNPTGENIIEAKKTADEINVKLNVIDCIDEYKNTVLKNFKNEYLSGRTPNPCVWCNSLIKFGVLIESARKKGLVFDKFATGHYAQVIEDNKRFLLKRGVDIKKDQSYFLYRLNQKQLSEILMPLGIYTKDEIREYAKNKGLSAFQKSDSQDFYSGDFNKLLGINDVEGNIVDVEGNILGRHKGIWNYTIGQRKGIKVSAKEALYVIELRKETNEVVVGFRDSAEKNFLFADNLNWIKFEKPKKEFKAKAKIRSAQNLKDAFVEVINDDKIKVSFDENQSSIAKGQSVVLYDEDDYVIGGGIIL